MTIKVTYNVTDVYVTQDVSPVYINVSYSSGGGSGAAIWGSITGTLSDQTDLQSALDGKVPYTGATANVDLGEYELKAGQVEFDQTPTGTAGVGVMRWNDSDGTVDLGLKGGNVTLQVGQESVVRVVNKTGANLLESQYKVCRVRTSSEGGAQGQRLAVVLAQANTKANHSGVLGIVTENINNNQEGFITTFGSVRDINTTGSLQGETWADGDVLWLSDTIAGGLTNVEPTTHPVQMGYVLYAHSSNGKIFVSLEEGVDELNELHDVLLTTPTSGQVLKYNGSLWVNDSVSGALGYTPANAATTLTINGVTYDLSANRTFSVGSVTGSGASGQVAYWDGTASQAGSNNLYWNSATNCLGIGTTSTAIASRKLSLSSTSSTYLQFINTLGRTVAIGNDTTGSFIVYDDTAANYRLVVSNAGNLLLGTTTDSGQRLQVQGTTLLNGNVTFSSSTGMFWDATNSRLGIGTNTPADLISLKGSSTFASIALETTGYATKSYIGNFQGRFYQFGSNRRVDGFISNASAAVAYINVFADNGVGHITLVATNTNNVDGNNVLRAWGSGNVTIQNGGTFSDSGERLQVTGNVKIVGAASDTTLGLLVQNSGGAASLRVRNDQKILIGNASTTAAPSIYAFTGITGDRSLRIGIQSAGSLTPTPAFNINQENDYTYTTGTGEFTTITANFLPTSGTGSLAYLSLKGTINQTGGANGITRGLYVNPTLTNAADFRAIETTNGKVIFGNLPTSSAGLPTGAIWNDAGTIKIV